MLHKDLKDKFKAHTKEKKINFKGHNNRLLFSMKLKLDTLESP